MLGRQRWIGTRRAKSAEMFQDAMTKYLPGLTEDDLRNPGDHYCETFFQKLGFDSVDSIDNSDFENATIIRDLSKPMDPETAPQFDVIYDGGTTEHIFDLPTAWRNIDTMLAPGGVVIGHSPCNNWLNHGVYQINPEAVFGFWEAALGYEVLNLILQPMRPAMTDRATTTTNPNETGMRPRALDEIPPRAPLMLIYAVRKPVSGSKNGADVHQTDYKARWAGAEAADD